jgi:ADP-dependent NAD(P)H-hydrate dehydratase / NAD(P)H-hydrate epimerase
MKILTAAEMRECDRLTTEKLGVPSLTLMENAGAAVAEYILKNYPAAKSIGVICGKGNNGGDGMVAARRLHEAGKFVRVLLLADPAELKGDAAQMYRRMGWAAEVATDEATVREQQEFEGVYDAELLVDAIFGTGFVGKTTPFFDIAIGGFGKTDCPVVSVDIPTGQAPDLFSPAPPTERGVARATDVVTFTAPKPVHVFEFNTARTVVADIGSPPEAVVSKLQIEVTTTNDLQRFLSMLARPFDANKGSFGHVLTIGGSLGKAGAAAMAGMAALRAGAGLSTVACPKSVLPNVAGFAPEVMTEPLPECDEGSLSLRGIETGRIYAIAQGKTVLAVGPGISRHPQASEFVRLLLHRAEHAIVLDADGLNAFEGGADQLNGRGRTLVVTPHPGEMARLTGLSVEEIQKDRIKVARGFANLHECIVVLKGWRTVIAKPDGEAWVNPTGNPGMATGGTGDILTGMIAGMIAQSPDKAFEATVAAVYLHGLAGDLATAELSEHAMVATDLLRYLPKAFLEVTRREQEKLVRIG